MRTVCAAGASEIHVETTGNEKTRLTSAGLLGGWPRAPALCDFPPPNNAESDFDVQCGNPLSREGIGGRSTWLGLDHDSVVLTTRRTSPPCVDLGWYCTAAT